MSLNLADLTNAIDALYDDTIAGTDDAATAKTNFVNGLALAIDTYVRSAHIVYTNGLSAGGDPVTGTFNGHLE